MTAPCVVCRTGVALTGERDADGDLLYPGNEYHTSNPRIKIRGVPYNGAVCSGCVKAYVAGLQAMSRHLVPVERALRERVKVLEAAANICDRCGEVLKGSVACWKCYDQEGQPIEKKRKEDHEPK